MHEGYIPTVEGDVGGGLRIGQTILSFHEGYPLRHAALVVVAQRRPFAPCGVAYRASMSYGARVIKQAVNVGCRQGRGNLRPFVLSGAFRLGPIQDRRRQPRGQQNTAKEN